MTELTAEEKQNSKELETKELAQQEDNLVMANRMIEQIWPSFTEAVANLSKKETAKLLKLLVEFPFVDAHKYKLNQKQKIAFMYGERLIYANMVKRARAELDRTFGEVQKEMVKNDSSTETSDSGQSDKENGNP